MLAFFLFFIGVMIGVVILIIFLNYPEEKSGTINNRGKRMNAKGGSADRDVKNSPDVPMPQIFDMNFFKERILEVRNSDTIVQAYIQSWITTFMGNQERKVLEELKRWAQVVKEVEDAQAEALLAQFRKQDILNEQQTPLKEKEVEKRLLQLQHEIEGLEADIAEQRARKAEAEARAKKAGEGQKTEEQKSEKKKPTPEEVREKDTEWIKQKIKDKFARYGTLDEAIRETYKMEFEKEQEIKQSNLPQDVEKEEIYRNKVLYANLRDEITKMQSRR